MSQTLQAIRSKYPQYKDVSDEELISSIGEKYPAYLDRDQEFRAEFDATKKDPLANVKPDAYQESYSKFGRLDPYGAQDADLITAVASDPSSIPGAMLETLMVPGKLAYGAAADVMSLAFDDPEYGGNVLWSNPGDRFPDQMPAEKFIADAAKTNPNMATAAHIGKSFAEMSPLAAVGMLPAWAARLATAGFTADMIAHAPELFQSYAEEINKPIEEQDPGKLSELKSGVIQTFTMAPLAGAVTVRGKLLTKGEKAKALSKQIDAATRAFENLEPSRVESPFGNSRLGVSPSAIGRAATDVLAEPDVQAVVEQAFAEGRPGYIAKPWELPAIEQLRRKQGIVPVERALKQDATGGKISFDAPAEARGIPNARQSAVKPPRQEPPPETGGTPVETPPEPPGTSPNVTEGIDFENIQRPHRVGVERGLELTESDVPSLEQQKKAAYEDALSASMTDDRAFKAAFGKGTYLEGVIEGAKRQGPNYDFYLKETGKSPEAAPRESVGITDPPPVADWVSTLEKWKYAEDAQGRILNPQGQLFSLPHPDAIKAIGKGAWNNAIDVAIAAIKVGRTAKEAIESAVSYLKKNVQGFDELKARENLSQLLELESPRVEGTVPEMRKSAARATTSEQVPEPVQERIAEAPESFYKVQPMKSVEEAVSGMSDADLAAVPEKSNIHVASKLELSRRLFDAGKLDEGYEVFKQVSKTGTDFGQNINQFKFLKGQNPLNVVHILNQGLKESGRDPLTKTQAEQVGKVASESIEANKALEKAKDDWTKDPTDANASKADAAHKTASDADLATQREMAKYKVKTWPQMLKAFAQGNPLTPISQVANIVGNSLGAAMEAGSRTLAAQMDIVRSALTGGERKVSVSPVSGTVEAGKGFGRGLAKTPAIMARGSGDVVKGEARAQLQPLRSLQKAFAANPDVPTVAGKVPFNERARLAVEGVFGIAPEIMLRMLAAADKPAYESARARLINEQSNLQNVPKGQRSMAQKFPEIFFDRDTLVRINDEASAAVFQRKSKTVSSLESLIKDHGGDWADLAFTLLVAPYRLTPWNLVGRTLIYNPLIAALRTSIDAAKGNTRAAEINAGRMIVGSMLYTAGYFLYKNALIGPSLNERDETQKARLLSKEVLPPNHVNIDGLKRLVSGGDPKYRAGDETWDLARGGGAAGAILSSVANIGRDFEKKPEVSENELIASLVKNSTLEQASFTVNQSFLKGVTGIMDAVRNRNIEPYMNGVENMLLNVGTPNTLSTISRATRKYVPDMQSDALDEAFNVVRNRFGFAGLDDYLPLKRDLWGKPMLQTPEGRNSILYHLFDISKNQQVTSDPVALELYQLWRETSDTRAIPSIPTKQVTLGDQTYILNPEQYAKYAELVGKHRREITELLVTNPNWQDLDAENKIKVLDSVYDKGAEIGKALLFEEFIGKMKPKAKKAGFTPAK